MSTNVSGSNNPIDGAAQSEKVTAALELAEDRDDDLTTSLIEIIADLQDKVTTLERTVEEKSALVEALRKKLSNYQERNEKDKAEIRRFATEKVEEASSSDADGGGTDSETTIHDDDSTSYRRETPLERLLDDPSNSAVRITKSVGRALTIAGNFKEWGKKIQGKYIINQGLKNLLSAGEHERLAWKQVHRAAHKLEELTNGNIEFKKTQHQGRILVIEDLDWFLSVIRRQRSEGVR